MRAALVAVTLAGLGLVAWFLSTSAPDREVRASLSVQETLGGADTTGYARADRVVDFDFPRDHGAHPDFRTEWWYFTGNLETAEGRRFGYQLTLFRSALAPPEGAGQGGSGPGGAGTSGRPDSDWATRQAWMGHLAVSDPAAGRFHAFERFDRGALGLAGAEVGPGGYRVWIGPWELAHPGSPAEGPEGVFPLELDAAADGVAIELVLDAGKGMVLQGDRGLSQKGPEPGNASYYFTFPRMPTRGTVRTPDGDFDVAGSSWLDREWSTSALSEGVVGWDWFALQLDGGRELMVYGLRREDGGLAAESEGVLVGPDGGVRRLGRGDFGLEATGRWESPVDGSAYPSGWRIRVPDEGLELEVEPVMDDQELDLAFRYWEGAVDVRGRGPDGPVRGRGYVELTGYAGAALPSR